MALKDILGVFGGKKPDGELARKDQAAQAIMSSGDFPVLCVSELDAGSYKKVPLAGMAALGASFAQLPASARTMVQTVQMTMEELWALFPIFLVAHREAWKDDYREIESELRKLLSDYGSLRISHIGSTAVSGIWAKNIVDVLVELPKRESIENAAELLRRNGFIIMSGDADRISLNRGYTKEGFADKVYHVHLRYVGDNDELYFRDYLNEHPNVAKEYEALKLDLWKKYEHNRNAYTDAKTDFIRRWTREARREYGNRYGCN